MQKRFWLLSPISILLFSACIMSCQKDQSTSTATTGHPTTPKKITDAVHSDFDSTQGHGTSGGGNSGGGGGVSYTSIDTALFHLNWGYYSENHLYDSSATDVITVNLPSGYDYTNTRVYLVGPQKATTLVWPIANSNSFYVTHINFPSGTYKVFVLSDNNGVLSDAVQQTTITANSSSTVTIASLTQASETDVVSTINNL